jgi:hypothetical protein
MATKKPAPKSAPAKPAKKKTPDLKVRKLTEDELADVAGGMKKGSGAHGGEEKSRQSVCGCR